MNDVILLIVGIFVYVIGSIIGTYVHARWFRDAWDTPSISAVVGLSWPVSMFFLVALMPIKALSWVARRAGKYH